MVEGWEWASGEQAGGRVGAEGMTGRWGLPPGNTPLPLDYRKSHVGQGLRVGLRFSTVCSIK